MQQQPLLPRWNSPSATRAATAKRARGVPLHAQAQPRVVDDADRIVQVCINLLSNAAKFSPAGERWTCGCAWRTAGAGGVANRGAGVPPEFQDRIFERFSQAIRRTAQQGGTAWAWPSAA